MSHRPSRAFTIIEITITIVIIAMLSGILLLAARHALSSARSESERALINSMKMAVLQFKQDHGFLPPLINDRLDANGNTTGNVLDGQNRPEVRDNAFLESRGNFDEPRYSIYSLQWYLMGALNITDANGPIDGGPGARFTEPNRDGTFKRKGKLHEPYFDPTTAGAKHVFGVYPATSAEEARVALTDRWGQPLRYYRWKPQFGGDGNVSQFLVPRSVGDAGTNPQLRDAEFAIVSLGPDQNTDNRRPLPTAGAITSAVDNAPLDASVNDNIVEVGR